MVESSTAGKQAGRQADPKNASIISLKEHVLATVIKRVGASADAGVASARKGLMCLLLEPLRLWRPMWSLAAVVASRMELSGGYNAGRNELQGSKGTDCGG